MRGTVYILEDIESGRLYIGSTSDLQRRLEQHRRGHTHTTKRMGLLRLVFQQSFPTLQYARKMERRLKSWKRKDFLIKIIADGIIKASVE